VPAHRIAVVALLALVACGSEPATPTARVVILADTHVIGPQYTEPHENSPADNESILRAPERLRSIRDRVNALEPRPDAVFVLGDVVHDAHHSMDPAWYDDNENAFTVARDIFAGFAMPVHVVMGNHDYEMSCDDAAYPRAFSEGLFRRFFGAPPYYSVEYGGVRFHMMNGQQGPTWDPASPDCDTEHASFGAAQLDWLATSLDDGVPSVVMSHYMGLLWARHENPGVPGRDDILDVLSTHANAVLYLAGHTHRWLDLSGLFGSEHYVVGPSRYDDDNFWILDLVGGAITITDHDKAIWNNTCAATYAYDPAPAPVDGATETGTCVSGIE
jgi:3',5'-cyclic AMP phosphodiesterase CpdA